MMLTSAMVSEMRRYSEERYKIDVAMMIERDIVIIELLMLRADIAAEAIR